MNQEAYIITQSKGKLYDLFFYVPLYFLVLWLTMAFVEPTARSSGKVYFFILWYPFFLIYLIYKYIKCIRNDRETLRIDSKRIVISGVKNELHLEWREIKKVELINGLVTKIVFHFKHKKEEIEIYGYQGTFKLKKALTYFGNGIEVIEPRKKLKYFYVPFW